MPFCHNDGSRSYKGNEPSPKGLGYCAHPEPLGSKKRGRDGRFWVIAADKNARKRWKPVSTTKPKSRSRSSRRRLKSKAIKPTSSYKNPVKNTVLISPYRKKTFDIIDNGGVSFKVEIKDTFVCIYKSKKVNHYDDDGQFEILVKKYQPEKLFIGDHLYGYKDDYKLGTFTGNSILLHLRGHRYVYIGSEIYEFTADSPILEYYSYMGNSGVPYPIAVSDKNIYLLIENVYMPISLFNELSDGHIGSEPYTVYYKELTSKEKKTYVHSIKLKMIHKSID